MSSKQWKAEKRFVLDCPICREPALPQQVSNQYGKSGFSLIHPGRIAPCFVREGTDAFEHVRTGFNGAFGTNDTTVAHQTRTGSLSDDRTYAGGGEETIVIKVPDLEISEEEWERYRDICYRHAYPEIDVWEGEGGACRSYEG